ncbi:MAG: electron transfer flavoprotein subunit alpha/FixB family protein [Firmicutes bacterium]|nr:electron transfer flavoprotein subunit alpha/FixB family protein [Bacillota bacterium]
MGKNIYLYLEFNGKTLSTAASEMLACALKLFAPTELTALIGQAEPNIIAGLPLNRIYYGSASPVFPYILAKAAGKLPLPDLLLAPMSAEGQAFAAAYAAHNNLPLIADVTDIAPEQQFLLVKRAATGNLGQMQATLKYPQVLLLHPGVWRATELPKQLIKPLIEILPLPKESNIAQLKRVYTASRTEMEVDEADIVVSGGGGMQSAEKFQSLNKLCTLLNASLGGSRIAIDRGWIEQRQLIGASGKTVAPQLYFCCGISGAVQHNIGMRKSRHIIAVNTDNTAPIFAEADLAVNCEASALINKLTTMLAAYQPVPGGIIP